MPKAGLTKSQHRRANQRRRKQSGKPFDDMGPAPALTLELAISLGNNLDRPSDSAPWEKAPAHVVDYDECPSVKTDELKRISARASNSRTRERNVRIGELKLKYQRLWGKRGAAKVIAQRETDDENPLSERTVQGYFKITKT